MSIRYLKVKIKSLAEEQRIIRAEERKSKRSYHFLKGKQGLCKEYEKELATFWGLRFHRTCDLRTESRAALLAYGFIRGKKYSDLEQNRPFHEHLSQPQKIEYDKLFARIAKLATKYGSEPIDLIQIEKWAKA